MCHRRIPLCRSSMLYRTSLFIKRICVAQGSGIRLSSLGNVSRMYPASFELLARRLPHLYAIDASLMEILHAIQDPALHQSYECCPWPGRQSLITWQCSQKASSSMFAPGPISSSLMCHSRTPLWRSSMLYRMLFFIRRTLVAHGSGRSHSACGSDYEVC